MFQVSIIPTAPLIAATLSQNDKKGSIGFCIDPAEGVEPVINLKHEEFPGRIIVQEPTTAISEDKKDKSDLALWSDGSKLASGSVGAAGVWKNSSFHSWKSYKAALEKNKEIPDAELWSISETLGVALRETTLIKVFKLTAFSDSQAL